MSILIKGMKMPDGCRDCVLSYEDVETYCLALHRYVDETKNDCPFVEVSEPHGRLIDADSLIKAMEERRKRLNDDESMWEESVVDTFLEDAPTVIKAEE